MSEREARYRAALEQIRDLENATEMRGFLCEDFTPEHLVKPGGWVPIHPRTMEGLKHAAKIARTALEEGG